MDGESGWTWDVLDEPGVDTGPVHLGVGGGGLNDDIVRLSQRSPQGPELIRNNLGNLFCSSLVSSFERLDFIKNKVRSNRADRIADTCKEGISPEQNRVL